MRALLVKEKTQREENQLGEKLPQFLWREAGGDRFVVGSWVQGKQPHPGAWLIISLSPPPR